MGGVLLSAADAKRLNAAARRVNRADRSGFNRGGGGGVGPAEPDDYGVRVRVTHLPTTASSPSPEDGRGLYRGTARQLRYDHAASSPVAWVDDPYAEWVWVVALGGAFSVGDLCVGVAVGDHLGRTIVAAAAAGPSPCGQPPRQVVAVCCVGGTLRVTYYSPDRTGCPTPKTVWRCGKAGDGSGVAQWRMVEAESDPEGNGWERGPAPTGPCDDGRLNQRVDVNHVPLGTAACSATSPPPVPPSPPVPPPPIPPSPPVPPPPVETFE